MQKEMVLTKKVYVKVQQQFASLAKIKLSDVERFRQLVLVSENKRNYALVTLLVYAGLRISEALNLKINMIKLNKFFF
jgi:integrase/recombinase XerD